MVLRCERGIWSSHERYSVYWFRTECLPRPPMQASWLQGISWDDKLKNFVSEHCKCENAWLLLYIRLCLAHGKYSGITVAFWRVAVKRTHIGSFQWIQEVRNSAHPNRLCDYQNISIFWITCICIMLNNAKLRSFLVVLIMGLIKRFITDVEHFVLGHGSKPLPDGNTGECH